MACGQDETTIPANALSLQTMQPLQAKRPRFPAKFSLRVLALFVALICAALFWPLGKLIQRRAALLKLDGPGVVVCWHGSGDPVEPEDWRQLAMQAPVDVTFETPRMPTSLKAAEPINRLHFSRRCESSDNCAQVLAELTHVAEIAIHTGEVSTEFISEAARFNLRELDVWDETMNDQKLTMICAVESLEAFTIASGAFGDRELRMMTENCARLTVLDISATNVTEKGILSLSSQLGLEELHCCGLPIGDRAIPAFMKLQQIRKVDLSLTSVSDDGYEALLAVHPELECIDRYLAD